MAKENSDFEFLMLSGFEWDEDKSNANLIKHGIDFEDAREVFYGPVIIRGSNRNNEERWQLMIELCRSFLPTDRN